MNKNFNHCSLSCLLSQNKCWRPLVDSYGSICFFFFFCCFCYSCSSIRSISVSAVKIAVLPGCRPLLFFFYFLSLLLLIFLLFLFFFFFLDNIDFIRIVIRSCSIRCSTRHKIDFLENVRVHWPYSRGSKAGFDVDHICGKVQCTSGTDVEWLKAM